MKMHKILCGVLAASFLTAGTFADDFGFDFGDSGESSSESSSAPATSLSVNGEALFDGRVYVDQRDSAGDRYDFKDFPTDVFPMFRLGLDYAGAYTDFSAKIKLNKFSLGDFKQDILEEFTARVYVNSNLQLEAGKMKVVWGKGDKLHVLDNFNANDYTDYIIPDYIDRRIAEPMFRAVFTTNSGIKFEGVYTPTMTGDRYASKGAWKPESMTNLESNVKSIIAQQLVANPSSAVDYASFSADDLYPDTNKIKYSQAGIRTTFTLGQVDLGASYYYGHYKQVSANVESLVNSQVVAGLLANPATKAAAEAMGLTSSTPSLPTLAYDRVNIFGLEAATVLWRFNTRAEFAYNLTADTAGDDPWVRNNSIAWLAGFDIDLPIHNVNLNVQNQGSYTLKYDKLDDEKLTYLGGAYTYSLKKYDVDYNGGHASNNKIVVAITDSWDHEKTKLDLKGIWGIERSDVIVMPKISRNIFDGFDLSLSGLFIWSKDEDSEFNGWKHNSFATIGAKYQF